MTVHASSGAAGWDMGGAECLGPWLDGIGEGRALSVGARRPLRMFVCVASSLRNRSAQPGRWWHGRRPFSARAAPKVTPGVADGRALRAREVSLAQVRASAAAGPAAPNKDDEFVEVPVPAAAPALFLP